MKLSNSLLCAASIVFVCLFSSCSKGDSDKSYSPDINLTFNTTKDISELTTRQYSIYVDGGLISTTYITGETYSNTVSLHNLKAPSTIKVDVDAVFTAGSAPQTINVQNSYKIKCTLDNGFATHENTVGKRTIDVGELQDYINDDLSFSVEFKINADGRLTK